MDPSAMDRATTPLGRARLCAPPECSEWYRQGGRGECVPAGPQTIILLTKLAQQAALLAVAHARTWQRSPAHRWHGERPTPT